MIAKIALLVLSAAVTPATQQRAAVAVYQVLTNYQAKGLFQGFPDVDGTAPMSEEADGTLTLGTAFAVSPDGWLMTARHVVEPSGKLADLCERLSKGWPGSVLLRRTTFTMSIEDVAGNNYGIIAELTPQTAGENLCIPGTPYDIRYDSTTTARIAAVDSVADLALLKLDVPRILYLPLTARPPARWADVFAVGYTDPGVRTTFSGAVAVRCEQNTGECVDHPDGTISCPTSVVMRTTAAVQEGMSGSPQVVNGAVVGVTVMKAVDVPVGFAIPSPYALRWYRSVRWPHRYRRPTTVCQPTPEH